MHVHRCMTPLHRAAVLSGKTATAIKQLRVQYYCCRLFLNLRLFKEVTAPLPAYRCSESPSKSFQPRIYKVQTRILVLLRYLHLCAVVALAVVLFCLCGFYYGAAINNRFYCRGRSVRYRVRHSFWRRIHAYRRVFYLCKDRSRSSVCR